MDEKEIARICAEAISSHRVPPSHFGIIRGYNMVIISAIGDGLDQKDRQSIRSALIEAERRTSTQLGMVRFL